MIDVMARKVSVVTTDDLGGSPDAESVSFGLDGVSYEIDLAAANKTRLAAAVAPYLAAGRKVIRRRRAPQPAAGGRVDRAAVRAWARDAGLAVSERGRISTKGHEPVRGPLTPALPVGSGPSPESTADCGA